MLFLLECIGCVIGALNIFVLLIILMKAFRT